MRFKYTPEGAPTQTWDLNHGGGRIMNAEAVVIEKLTGLTFDEFKDLLPRGSVLAHHALLYVFLKREDPTLQPSQVQFYPGETEAELDLEDLTRLRSETQGLLDAGKVAADKVADAVEALAALDVAIAEKERDLPDRDSDEDPKEAEPTSSTSGGPSSLPSGDSIPETLSV